MGLEEATPTTESRAFNVSHTPVRIGSDGDGGNIKHVNNVFHLFLIVIVCCFDCDVIVLVYTCEMRLSKDRVDCSLLTLLRCCAVFVLGPGSSAPRWVRFFVCL